MSRSSRWTSSRNLAFGRCARSCSMTPKLMPLPPWTATPAGLSMHSRASSSSTTGTSRRVRGGPFARPCCDTHRAAGATRRRPARRYSGFDAAAVDPHLAAAQDPVDMALRHAFEYADQEIVDALAPLSSSTSCGDTESLLKSFILHILTAALQTSGQMSEARAEPRNTAGNARQAGPAPLVAVQV